MPVVKKLGQLLIQEGRITSQQLTEALAHQEKNQGLLGQILVKLGLISGYDLHRALARHFRIQVVDLSHVDIPAAVIRRVCVIFVGAVSLHG